MTFKPVWMLNDDELRSYDWRKSTPINTKKEVICPKCATPQGARDWSVAEYWHCEKCGEELRLDVGGRLWDHEAMEEQRAFRALPREEQDRIIDERRREFSERLAGPKNYCREDYKDSEYSVFVVNMYDLVEPLGIRFDVQYAGDRWPIKDENEHPVLPSDDVFTRSDECEWGECVDEVLLRLALVDANAERYFTYIRATDWQDAMIRGETRICAYMLME